MPQGGAKRTRNGTLPSPGHVAASQNHLIERARELKAANAQLEWEIAQRKQTEEQLRKRNEELQRELTWFSSIYDSAHIGLAVFDRAVLDVLPVGVFIIDNQGQIVGTNPAAAEIWADAKLLGIESWPRYKMFTPDGRVMQLSEMPAARTLKTGQAIIRELLQMETSDGKRKWLLVSTIPLRQADGNTSGLVAVNEDVTALHEANEEIAKQQRAILELSTPVLPVRDRFLIMPLIGVIDAHRARQLSAQLLKAIGRHRAKVVVLDVTGVASIDTKIAGHLLQTIEAARLLGAQVIVTGISTDIAATLTTTGVDLSHLVTVGDLRRGIEEAERLLTPKDR